MVGETEAHREESTEPNTVAGSPPPVGSNLRRLRSRRGLSLERLAQRSGVSRAMLSQIELGRSVPTINSLWRIARALDVTFSALINQRLESAPVVLPRASAKVLSNRDGTFTSRALFPYEERRRTEFYGLHLKQGGEERARAHLPGTIENLVVTSGAVEIDVEDRTYRLDKGDAILFSADVPHAYRSVGKEDTEMYLVMTYAEEVG